MCDLHPVLGVTTKYLKLTLMTSTESCRAWSTAPRCTSGIEYKNHDFTAQCAWPCRVTTFQVVLTATDEPLLYTYIFAPSPLRSHRTPVCMYIFFFKHIHLYIFFFRFYIHIYLYIFVDENTSTQIHTDLST